MKMFYSLEHFYSKREEVQEDSKVKSLRLDTCIRSSPEPAVSVPGSLANGRCLSVALGIGLAHIAVLKPNDLFDR